MWHMHRLPPDTVIRLQLTEGGCRSPCKHHAIPCTLHYDSLVLYVCMWHRLPPDMMARDQVAAYRRRLQKPAQATSDEVVVPLVKGGCSLRKEVAQDCTSLEDCAAVLVVRTMTEALTYCYLDLGPCCRHVLEAEEP